MTARTLYQVLEETAQRYGTAPALHQPIGHGNPGYLTYSWNDYKQAAEEIAAGLHALGIAKGDVVALDSETRLEFYLADLGILANGSISAALYPSYPPKDLIRTIESVAARAVFVEDAKGAAPSVPFWRGEAPGRSTELSHAVSETREKILELNKTNYATAFLTTECALDCFEVCLVAIAGQLDAVPQP